MGFQRHLNSLRAGALGVLGALGAAMLLGSATAALALPGTPVPDAGPVAGDTTVEVSVPGITLTEVAVGDSFSIAIGSDGDTYAWGWGGLGQLGNGTIADAWTPTPVAVPDGVAFTTVAASYGAALALGTDGITYAWGINEFGQLGDGTTTNRLVPTPVSAPPGVTFTAIAGGYGSAVALGSDGNTYAWGWGGRGQLGNGTTANSTTPVPVTLPAGVTFTALSADNGTVLALGSDGNTYAWGQGTAGELGNGSTADSPVPVQVDAPAGVTFSDIAAGNFSLALGSDGTTYAWGPGGSGELGNGTTTGSTIPVPVSSPAGVTFTDIAAGDGTGLALGSDGNTYAWGYGGGGELGNGTTANSLLPVAVTLPPGVSFSGISAGNGSAFGSGIGSNGSTYAWGPGGSGELGNGTNAGSAIPLRVSTPTGIVTDITFDGVSGTDLTDLGLGRFSVVTPAHAACGVDVVTEWTLRGEPQLPIVSADGFTYLGLPSVTNPSDQTVTAGDTAVFSVTATGCPAATAVTWEFTNDRGTTWLPSTDDQAAAVSSDGLTLTIAAAPRAHDGFAYRATVSNSEGSTVSEAATLTVLPAALPGPVPPDGGVKPPAGDVTVPGGSPAPPALAHTGAADRTTAVLGAGALIVVALLAGAAALRITALRR